MGSGEDKRYLALRQNHTRVQWRQNVPSGWRRKVSFMYAHVGPRHTHTFEKLQSWPNAQTLNTLRLLEKTQKIIFIFVQIPSIGQPSQQTPHSFDGTALQQQLPTKLISANIYSTHALTSNPFLVGPQAPQPLFIHLCTNLHAQH